MPFCPNPDCGRRQRLGEPAEFLPGRTTCSDCGSALVETAPVFDDAPATATADRPGDSSPRTCPHCGAVNSGDLSRCVCGHDRNRPSATAMTAKKIDEGPDYANYTLGQLYDVYDHIDREQFPDRFNRVIQEIEKRKNPSERVSEGPVTAEEILAGGRVREPQELALRFHGESREYFRIWIVNLCLTLLTFGIFSAWAKVRRKRYFYSRTTLDGTPFQYLGQPVPILKGRVVAAIAFSLYYASDHLFTALLPYVLVAGAVLAPWVLVRSAAFNARYSAYRNMTFHFDGRYADALKALSLAGLVPALAIAMTFEWRGKYVVAGAAALLFGIAFPWWMRRLKDLLISHSSYGGRNGTFSATGGQFFSVYFKSGLIMVGVLFVVGIVGTVSVLVVKKSPEIIGYSILVPTYAGYILAYAYVQAQSSNLVWNNTKLGPLRFRSSLSGWGLAKLYVVNALGIIASLGLLIPWAVMRTLRYRTDHMRVHRAGELTEFQGSDRTAVAAAGAETVDFFDLDISL